MAKSKEYIIYSEDDCGNGSMEWVKEKSLAKLIENNFPQFEKPEFDEDDEAGDCYDEDNLIQDFEMWCGENNENIMVFDLDIKETVIGYR